MGRAGRNVRIVRRYTSRSLYFKDFAAEDLGSMSPRTIERLAKPRGRLFGKGHGEIRNFARNSSEKTELKTLPRALGCLVYTAEGKANQRKAETKKKRSIHDERKQGRQDFREIWSCYVPIIP